MIQRDYQDPLGIDPLPGKEEIKKAHRRPAHQFHPDKSRYILTQPYSLALKCEGEKIGGEMEERNDSGN